MKYSDAQRQSIEHNKGPMMVLAGPGSGKTLVITRRTRHLIEQCGVNPAKILVITFTKAAAEEMSQRFAKLMKSNSVPVNFGTFHSTFYAILRYAYNYGPSNILKEDVKYGFLKSMIDKYSLTIEDEKEFIQGLENEISLVKGEMMNIAHYYSTNCADDVFRKIYEDYGQMLSQNRLIDFDDMLVLTYKLFKEYPDVLKSWQDKFEYILIDEFQDINRVQYEIIKMLAKPQDNLFIVGDDDQSIYRFRGAKPEIMKMFAKDYEGLKTTTLATNYRCSANIVKSAKRVIKNNLNRFEKDIYTDNEEGQPVNIQEFYNATLENKRVIEQIRESHVKGTGLNEIAILYRTNTMPRALLLKLMEFNIPFKIRDGVPSIYDHWISKNIIAYINLAVKYSQTTPKSAFRMDRGLFLQIANRPNRYISRDTLNTSMISFEDLYKAYYAKAWMIERINKLEYDISMLSNMTPYAAINYIRNVIGYEEYLDEYAKYRKMNLEELIDILDELEQTSKEYETYEKWFAHIEKYKEEMERKVKEKQRPSVPSVTLSTFHGSKGLEFDEVFIIGANEGLTPHHKSVKKEDIEEERRMFYVAMTRARKKLYIYYSKERYNKELTPSRFVGEIFIDKEELIPGTRLVHNVYGNGVIVSVEENRLKVKFDKIMTEKILDVDYCISSRIIKLEG